MSEPKNKVYTQTEIGQALNNAVAAAFGSPTLKGLEDKRKRQLRNYLSGIIEAVLEHRKEGYLTAEELVATLASGALFVQVLLVNKRNSRKLPMFDDIASDMSRDYDK